MPNLSLIVTIQWFLIISFLFYGASCFISEKNKQEFQRYRLLKFRKVIGALQLAACAGLSLGLTTPYMTVITSLALSIMMFFAVLVRWRIKDSPIQSAPALIYFLLSLLLFISSL